MPENITEKYSFILKLQFSNKLKFQVFLLHYHSTNSHSIIFCEVQAENTYKIGRSGSNLIKLIWSKTTNCF